MLPGYGDCALPIAEEPACPDCGAVGVDTFDDSSEGDPSIQPMRCDECESNSCEDCGEVFPEDEIFRGAEGDWQKCRDCANWAFPSPEENALKRDEMNKYD